MTEFSTDRDKLMLAFAKAQHEFKNPKKSAANTFHKSKYATLDACMDAVKEALFDNGLVMIQAPKHENVLTGSSGDTTQYSDHWVLETIIMHVESGQWMRWTLPLDFSGKAQARGSEITYARRYALGFLGITPEEDDDGNSAAGLEKPGTAKAEEKKRFGKRPEPPPPTNGERVDVTGDTAQLSIWAKALGEGEAGINRVMEIMGENGAPKSNEVTTETINAWRAGVEAVREATEKA